MFHKKKTHIKNGSFSQYNFKLLNYENFMRKINYFFDIKNNFSKNIHKQKTLPFIKSKVLTKL